MKIQDYFYSRANQVFLDCSAFAVSFFAAFVIRFERWPDGPDLHQFLLWLPILVSARLLVHFMLGIYRHIWRFVSFPDAIEIAKSIAIVSAFLAGLRLCVPGGGAFSQWVRIPISVIVLEGLLSLTLSMGIRALRRVLYSFERKAIVASRQPVKRVLLYGAGRAGIMALKELETNGSYDVIGFIDDDPRKLGSAISNTCVVGNGDHLAQLVAKYHTDEIIISMATASRQTLARILSKCTRANLPATVIPSLREILAGQVEVSGSRETRSVLVIGGAGYIGCWLVRRLLEEGRHVRVMDNAVYGVESIQDLLAHPNLDYLNGDCRNIQDVVKAMRGVSSIVHLAAIVGDPACEIDRKTAIEINYSATRMIIEIAKGHGVERLLFASSCSVYGATDELMNEESRVEPVSLYGETKVSSEQALLQAAGHDFHPVLMRFATVFGLSNRPRFDLVVNLLSAKAHQDGVIPVFNGKQQRPFVHVKDVGEAMVLLLKAPLGVVSGQVFNVGDNRLNRTLAQVAEVIQRVFPGTRVEHSENADRRNYRVSFDKIEKRLGFRCRYELEDGVREIKTALDSSQIDNYQNIRFNNLVFLRESGSPGNKSDIDAEVMAAFGGDHFRRAVAAQLSAPLAKSRAAASS
jgi:nucleoside-diphosphate-sugar epimerase